MTLPDPTYCRIARHLPNVGQVLTQQEHRRSATRRRERCLDTRVPRPYNDDVVVFDHGSTSNLFTEAEIGKHSIEHILAGDVTDDVRKCRGGRCEVVRHELQRRARRQRLFGP